MEKKQMYTAVAAVVVVIIVVAAVAWYMTGNNGGSDETDDGDTYYVYLDGMGDANGWHSGNGNTSLEAISNAFESDGIAYDIGDDGWISSINGLAYDGTNGFGVFVYTSTDFSNPYAGYFCAGPVVTAVNGNVLYISYGSYDENYNSTLNPSTSPDSAAIFASGPFTDDSYEPLVYDNTYYVYLDGMGDVDGWYSGTGANGSEGILDALDGKVECIIGDDGWISSINGLAYDGTNGFGVFVYTSTDLSNPYAGYFGAGPTTNTVTGNILYISYGSYDENYNSTLNPSTSPDSTEIMSGGPFATA